MGEVIQIDLNKDAVYVVKGGNLSELPKPFSGHGSHTFTLECEITVNWQGNKPCHGKMVHDFKF